MAAAVTEALSKAGLERGRAGTNGAAHALVDPPQKGPALLWLFYSSPVAYTSSRASSEGALASRREGTRILL